MPLSDDPAFAELRGRVRRVHTDVTILKTDVAELEEDVVILQTDFAGLKVDVWGASRSAK